MNREKIEVSKFLEWFSPISLDYIQPDSFRNPWVFWSENEGFEKNPFSSSAADPKIHHMIIYMFYHIRRCFFGPLFGQFWAPVIIGGRQILSTSSQPFAVWDDLSNELAKYRLYTEDFKYNIDMNYNYDGDDMIISGGPATSFISRLPHLSLLQWVQVESFVFGGRLNCSVMLPVCFPSQTQSSSCIGVLEFTFDHRTYPLVDLVLETMKALNKAGLDVISVQDLIPYKDMHALKLATHEIQEALKFVCETHNLALAQVWITNYEHKNHVLLSSSLEDTQTNSLSASKLTGYCYNVSEHDNSDCFSVYFRVCDVIPRGIYPRAFYGVELPLETLKDYGSHYISALPDGTFVDWEHYAETSALAICLRDSDTGDFNFVLEFLWTKRPKYVNLLEGIILTLKKCLPRIKFSSGAELGDELEVLVTESNVDSEDEIIDETEKIKIFKGKRSSPMPKAPEEGKSYIAPSNVMRKTTAKVLPREAIEKQFGKTMNEAAKNLNVSLSTFKRKFKELGIPEWPGPNFMKKKANDSSSVQIDTNEEDNGAIQEATTININHNTLTIKAEHSIGMIKFHLPISQASFATIEQEIGMKLNLSVGTYMLSYLDEDGDWILLTSDEELCDCIKSSRKSYRSVVKIRVLPSPQPISGPGGSFGMQSIL